MAAITIKNMDVTYNKGKSYVIKDMNLSILKIYDRHWLTPVSLSCKYPLSEVIVSLSSCYSHLFKLLGNSFLSLFYCKTCEFL